MTSDIKWVVNNSSRNISKGGYIDYLTAESANLLRKFFSTFPQYSVTPLHSLSSLAKHLNIAGIYVKDESYRFGLNAFKVLGGAYAISRCLCSMLNIDIYNASFELLSSEETRKKLGDLTFITATDGNHGKGVAWAARTFGFKSVVLMPKGSALSRLENIKKEGADVSITDYNYDDAVRYAKALAAQNNWVMVQDTAWEGYEDIPKWIMQGYSVIADEALEQIAEKNVPLPTHVILQAGVGSFAGAIQGYLFSRFGDQRPYTIIAEPHKAACIYESFLQGDGKPHNVGGDLETIMAGLACGEPNIISWEILRDYSDIYASCGDSISARGMRILGNPLKDDPKVISGESGAVGLGLLSMIAEKQEFAALKEQFKLDEKSRVLLINTEGDTDPNGYREVVWDGKCPSYE